MYKRHLMFYAFFRPLVRVYLFLKFGYRCDIAKNLMGNYIVLSNHVTDFDPLFVGASFPRQMYFVASEHIARWKYAYKFLKYGFAPIIRNKGTTATATVMEMLRMVKKGSNVCMFAEGARSWDGVTAPILASTGKVVKSARCGLVTYRIQGGYFVSPNWSEGGTRKGSIYGKVVNVYTKEQLAKMTVEEINEIITRDLHEDAYERQLKASSCYKGKNLAVRMENLLFCCPKCGAMDTIHSQRNTVACRECGMSFQYTEYGMLEGIEQMTVKELFAWQKERVHKDATEHAVYTASFGSLKKLSQHEEELIGEGAVRLDENGISCGKVTILLEDIQDMAMHGRRALVFSTKDTYYELVPAEGENTLKFHMLYQIYKEGALTQYDGRIRK